MTIVDASRLDAIRARIDAAVGAPEDETEEEHEARRRMVARDHEARRIRRANDTSN